MGLRLGEVVKQVKEENIRTMVEGKCNCHKGRLEVAEKLRSLMVVVDTGEGLVLKHCMPESQLQK